MISYEMLAIAIGIMYDGSRISPNEIVTAIDIKEDKLLIYLRGYELGESEYTRTETYEFNTEKKIILE